MPEPRDVFIVCNNIDGIGGLQRWARHIAGLFAARGHRVTLVGVTRAPEPHPYEPDGSFTEVVLHDEWRPPALAWRAGTLRKRLNVAARGRDLWRTAGVRRGAGRLSELFARAGPGAVVIVAQVWAMEWVRNADTAGLKVVGMSHESYAASRSSSRHRRVKEHFTGADRFLALTAEDADAWARAGMTNADHMPNPLHVAPGFLAPGSVTPGAAAPLGSPVVASVGRLSREKGNDLLLEAWERAGARHRGWSLHVYGGGPQEDELRAQADAAGLAGSVEFRGVTSEVEAALTGASVFALPSRAEGFPMSVLESMAFGLPTVAFDCAPGVRELLDDGETGLLVRPGDTAAFAAALDRLVDDAELRRRMGAAARGSVQRFRPDRVLDRWERLFSLLHSDVPPQRSPENRSPETFPAARPVQ